MLNLVKVFFVGMLVSFLGQLPLGNVNLSATQLNVQEGHKKAWQFGLGLALVEVIYLRIALTGMDWVIEHKTLFIILGWMTVAMFMGLGIASFIAARKQDENKKGLLLSNKLHRFWLGISVSAVNPVQIPFWFTWSIYLLNAKLLLPTNAEYNFFTVGAGLGSLAGLAIYIYGGKWIIGKLKANNKTLNKFMGVIFIVVALIQVYKMIFDPWTDGGM